MRMTPTTTFPQLVIRTGGGNANHHLWNNNGTWWIVYTIYPNAVQKERVRASLKTKSVNEARARRKAIFNALEESK